MVIDFGGVKGIYIKILSGLINRMLFALLRSGLGVLLLSDISFKSTYPIVHQFPIARGGLSPLNTSVVYTHFFNMTATAEFWWYFPALLTDNKRVKPVAPLNCSGNMCNSFFIPGSMTTLQFDPQLPPITQDSYPEANSLIQNDAPGYQVEFKPIDANQDPPMLTTDCRVYGISIMAIQICLKKVDSSIMAGTPTENSLLTQAWLACPTSVGQKGGCLNTEDWRLSDLFNTKMTISERRASTVFNRFNATIIDIIDLSDPTPTSYGPNDFFPFYDIIFSINQSQPDWMFSTQYLFLTSLASYLRDNVDVQLSTGNDDRLSRLQEFLSVPIVVFNNVVYKGPTVNMGQSATLVSTSYRVFFV
jgi:hypothetical protein